MLAHIRTVEKVKVKAGPKLWQAIESIPVATGVSITPEQFGVKMERVSEPITYEVLVMRPSK